MQGDPIAKLAREVDELVDTERLRYAPNTPDAAEDTGKTAEGLSSEVILDALQKNEDGDAALYVELNRGHFVYDHAAAQWFVFAGHYWQPDLTEQALSGVADVVSLYMKEMKRQAWKRAKAEKDGQSKAADTAKALEDQLARRIRDLQTVRRKQAILQLARAGDNSLGITGDEWDRDPWALAVANGVLDLKTGAFRPGKPTDYFRAHAPTRWEGADAPRLVWEAFLASTFGHDGRLVAFKQRVCGYAATGQTVEHSLFILWGAGSNGKTVFLQAIADTLGPDLAGPIDSEMLLQQRFNRPSGGASSDLLHLRGRRFAWLSETNENRKLNAGRVKLLTGGDLLTGRPVYGKRQITFTPTHTLFLCTNHKPRADASDFALWRRMCLTPFTQTFVNEPGPGQHKADPHLAEKLRAERPGILAWLVEGCLLWQQQGLNPPEIVRAATSEYQRSEDTLQGFIDECCAAAPGLSVRAGALYAAYKAWTESNGERAMTGTKFGRYFSERFDSAKDTAGKYYIGISVAGGQDV
jgi:putative DNA primase/helicase